MSNARLSASFLPWGGKCAYNFYDTGGSNLANQKLTPVSPASSGRRNGGGTIPERQTWEEI
jgi:hypothetical protein